VGPPARVGTRAGARAHQAERDEGVWEMKRHQDATAIVGGTAMEFFKFAPAVATTPVPAPAVV
jgi:hypothetical protein